MSVITAVRQELKTELRSAEPQQGQPDVFRTAGEILTQAMEYCAQKMQLDSPQTVVARLRSGEGKACEYCHYSVAKQVAATMGTLDTNIKAAYIYDYDATPEDLCFGATGRGLPIHLLIWAERKTAALSALAETLGRALAQQYAVMIGVPEPAHLLDVQVVDDTDVNRRLGHAALLSSLYHRPVEIWKR
jgi:hypothetical protein